MPGTISFLKQSFPPKPTFTDKDVPDLTGKVTLVTGSNTGLGKEVARILYSKNAKVYMMARSESKTREAMQSIKSSAPGSKGSLIFLPLDLSDLTTIRASAAAFLAREQQLHLLVNNAGVGHPAHGSRTAQGYELQLGVNCIGTFAFTQQLTPTIVATARALPAGSVRVLWVASNAAEGSWPATLLEDVENIDKKATFDQYCISKLGCYFNATEFAARHRADGVVSIPLNPGALDSDFWRTSGACTTAILRKTLLYPPVYGAYTVLWAAFSSEVTIERSGDFVTSWGRFWSMPKQWIEGAKTESQGGTGIAKKFWDWTDAQARVHL